jgi:RimJ/RimL family protein N-acetyltransferase
MKETINKRSLNIEGIRIHLRPLQPSDVTDEYVEGLNDTEVNRYLVSVRQYRQTRDTVQDFVVSNLESPASILFGIFIRDHDTPLVGTVRVSEMDLFHYSAVVGICLFAKRAWKKGYACEAVRMVKDYLFENRCFHYLEAGVYAENRDSIRLFTRAGFTEWFRVKSKYRHKDSFEEAIFFAAINPFFDLGQLKEKTPLS